MDKRFNFESIVACKIVVKKDGKVLLIREPDANDWMPNRLGLPGGKSILNESIIGTLKRKIELDIGMEIKIKGLIKVLDILMPEKNVYHFIFIADHIDGEIGHKEVEPDDIKWYSVEELNKLGVDDYTEYYNKELLDEIVSENYNLIPIETVKVQDNREGEIMSWMKKGNNK